MEVNDEVEDKMADTPVTQTMTSLPQIEFPISEWKPEPHPEYQRGIIHARPWHRVQKGSTYSKEEHLAKHKKLCARMKGKMTSSPYKVQNDKRTAERKFRQAVIDDDYDAVEQMLLEGVDPSGSDEKFRTALHFASAKGNEGLVCLLLNRGADPDRRDLVGNTPLHLAAGAGHIPVVTLLLKAGTNVNAVDSSGRSPANLAISRFKMLQGDRRSPSEKLNRQALQVMGMLKEYLVRSGKSKAVPELDRLVKMLEETSFDEVGALLSNFAGMQIAPSK